ncbi:hypothetical protein [Leptospira sp. severe_002]|uniref:hypothetical protein n=1 Tax=Leptospira sp. severe_002 TaxID=2838237 RepID=UPI001E2C22F0|nr:hypothetical protein [Leptospira sp. severe_002]
MASIPSISGMFQSSGWLSDAFNSIDAQAQSDGMLGALQNSKNALGSARTAIFNNATNANALMTISSSTTQAMFDLTFKQAQAALDKRAQQQLARNLALQPSQPKVQAKLDPMIFFENGSTLDTVNNILTMSDGSQIDSVTGQEYVAPESLVQFGNGSYLNTKTNVMTMSDGTKIDTVTGLKITT